MGPRGADVIADDVALPAASTSSLTPELLDALRSVTDPEYPDISIVDLGLVESVVVVDGSVTVGLIPTFSGCPALAMIAADVRLALETVGHVERCVVEWLPSPAWSTARMSATARDALASDYTVVLRGVDGTLRCPICGSRDVRDQSMAGPTRCRSISWCDACRNPVEVMR
ncbi:MAG: 1,2-phenylacetyl-CoA epoxidase subunit PaaD [Actinomycetota bacterium]